MSSSNQSVTIGSRSISVSWINITTVNSMDLGEPYEGQKFASFDVLKKYLEEYGKRNYIKLWTRSSHTINSLKSKSKKFNPAMKYTCMKFACIFGGEKTRCRGTGIRRSTTYRNLGCPFTINAVIGADGNHVRLETVILDHNHSLGKSLYDSLKKSKNKMKILQDEIDNSDFARRIHPRTSSHRHTRGIIARRQHITFNHVEILRPHGRRKGLIRTDNAMAAKIATTEAFQVCIREIQAKYGSNIKIIIVNRDEPETSQGEDRPYQEINEDQLSQLRREFDESERIRNSSFSQICRLCLSSTNELHPIFDPSQPLESTLRSFKIMSCASIDVSKDDGLPGNICTACEEQLDLAYNFRTRSENADTALRELNPVNEYIGENEIPLLSEEDLEEIESYEQEEVQSVVEPEEQTVIESPEAPAVIESPVEPAVIESPVLPQENVDHLDLTKNIIFYAEHQVYAQFEDSCPICGCNFGTYSNMLQHLEEHNDIGNFLLSCNFCSAIFSTVKNLVDHLNGHMMARALRDDPTINPETIVQEGHETDVETEQVEEEPPVPESQPEKAADTGYLCNVCGKILKSKDRFQSHKNTHEGLRPHVCIKCGRGFADRKNMHQHYDIVHLRKAKHECPICHKKFYAPTKMKSHLTMHYDLKPFSCDICNKTFRLRMNMIKHKKTHSNERPHKCDKCKAAFIDKNLLTRHSYVHGGIRPHVCAECGHRFTLKFNLKKHLTSGRCNSKRGADDFAWENVTAFKTPLAETGDNDRDDPNNLVEELLQELGAE